MVTNRTLYPSCYAVLMIDTIGQFSSPERFGCTRVLMLPCAIRRPVMTCTAVLTPRDPVSLDGQQVALSLMLAPVIL